MDDIESDLILDGWTGYDRINIYDRGSAPGQQYRDTRDSLTRVGGPAIGILHSEERFSMLANAPQAMPNPGNETVILSTQPGAEDTIETGDNDDLIAFILTEPLVNADITIDGGLNRDRVVVAQGFVSTDQVHLVNTEDLEVLGDGFSPGGLNAAGTFVVTGDYVQTSSGRLYLALGTPGIGSDQLVVGSTVTLDGTLTLGTLPGFTGNSFTLIDNAGLSPVSGTFAGLPEGAYLYVGGREFQISYVGGSGNDVVLTATGSVASGGSIGDRVWDDTNVDGIQDASELGMAGVAVKLLNGTGQVLTFTTTDSSGNYLFTGLAAGQYSVYVEKPADYSFTIADAGMNDGLDSDFGSDGMSPTITLAYGQSRTDIDAGLIYGGPPGDPGDPPGGPGPGPEPPPASLTSISGRVWYNSNGNGIQDSWESTGFLGVLVHLYDEFDVLVDSTITSSGGFYAFADIDPGNYYLEFIDPPGDVFYSFSPQDQGADDSLDSDVDVSGVTALFTLLVDTTKDDLDAGVQGIGIRK